MCEQECCTLLEGIKIFGLLAQEPACVVILQEAQQVLHISIYEIIAQVVVDATQATILRLIVKYVAGHTHQREVHNRLKVCVILVERTILLPPRCTNCVLGPHLTYDVKLRHSMTSHVSSA